MAGNGDKAQQARVAAVVTGIVIAVADGRYADAGLLADGLSPGDAGEAVRQLAGLVVDLARHDGHTAEAISKAFGDLALDQAAAAGR
jgi:hypothetical protein